MVSRESSLSSVVGVDGCRSGWFFVQLDDQGFADFGVVSALAELLTRKPLPERIFVDIPIGLRDAEGHPRGCDTAARKLLGSPRGTSVFPAPVRAILDAQDYDAARSRSRALTGKSPSRQAFGIMPKIREADRLMQDNEVARRLVREVHPELCFWGLAGGRPMTHKKSKPEGFDERLEVLARHYPQTPSLVQSALSDFPRKDVARDDILDALVCAVVASTPGEWRTAPEQPEIDSVGLPMEIVYVLAQFHGQLGELPLS